MSLAAALTAKPATPRRMPCRLCNLLEQVQGDDLAFLTRELGPDHALGREALAEGVNDYFHLDDRPHHRRRRGRQAPPRTVQGRKAEGTGGHQVSLADALAHPAPNRPARRAKPDHPKGWEPNAFEFDGAKGYVNTGTTKPSPGQYDKYLRESGLDPDTVEVIEPIQVRGWQNYDGDWLHYYRLTVVSRSAQRLPDLQQLIKAAKASRAKAKTPPTKVESAVVAVWADPQTGKVASRGGTEALIRRVESYQAQLRDYCKAQKADAAYLLDAGDAIEGFENLPSQHGTNDLSLMDQVDVATTIEFELFKTLGGLHQRAVLAGVGSNHCRWRNGKNELGTPGDDWGVHMLKQIHRRITDSPEKYGHMSVTWPDRYEETLALDVAGYIIGLAHGHRATRPEKVTDWWAKQVHGGQPLAHADLLVTGHFHSFWTQPSGSNPHTGRSKWWMQAPTADNGSDWYRYAAGSDSEPGMLVFTVTADGWDNLKILR